MKITFFDAEYANARNKSVCQIGILSRDLNDINAEIVQIDILVNPVYGFAKTVYGFTA